MIAQRVLAGAALFSLVGALIGCSTGSDTPPATPSSTTSTAMPTATPTAQAAQPLSVDDPADGATVSVPFLVTGSAKSLDSTLTIEALDAVGTPLCTLSIPASAASASAASASAASADWQGTLAFPPPDAAELVTLRVYTAGQTDGAPTDLVARALTVSAAKPAIYLAAPACGATAEAGRVLTVTGRAAVFEATLSVELRDSSGAAVLAAQTVADACCVESNFGVVLSLPADLPAGQYDVVAFNVSATDGSKQNEFPVQIHVQ